MSKPSICRLAAGHLGGRSGEWLEMSDGSLWFHPNTGAAPVCQQPRNQTVATYLAALHPDTTGEFDPVDWDNGGDGWVYK